jgi:hypothetical protein
LQQLEVIENYFKYLIEEWGEREKGKREGESIKQTTFPVYKLLQTVFMRISIALVANLLL